MLYNTNEIVKKITKWSTFFWNESVHTNVTSNRIQIVSVNAASVIYAKHKCQACESFMFTKVGALSPAGWRFERL